MRESLGDCSAVSVGNIVVSVTDTGVGLSAEHQRHLFQEGRQFNANRLQGGEGSGLGLYIAKGVVVLHDGTLSAYSAGEGTGCTFTMVLPAVQIQWNDSADAHSLEEGISLQSMIPFMSERAECEYKLPTVSKSIGVSEDSREVIRHVLVVDDSIPSRKMIARLLSNAGYDCQQACDGQECVDIMVRNREDPSASRIQLIFMDYEMPRINGPEACEILRNKGFTIPIIGVTGNVLPADCDYFISHGASVVLAKPLDLNKLNRVFMQFS
ncbi:tcsA [Symbiodinium microadriaticum]|nr:tcsA [Symbiodinium microadriaticum]